MYYNKQIIEENNNFGLKQRIKIAKVWKQSDGRMMGKNSLCRQANELCEDLKVVMVVTVILYHLQDKVRLPCLNKTHKNTKQPASIVGCKQTAHIFRAIICDRNHVDWVDF